MVAANHVAPLVVIVGETASGKSALALELAQRINGELICADSWTVYKGFDIGTAKPTPEERARVRHHLLDVADPSEGFSAVLFQRMANEAIEDIAARGKLPIMVGGTGLYIDSVLYDYSFLPASSQQVRAELNAMELPELINRAEKMQLDTSGIDLRNKRRVIRLIENEGEVPTKHDLRQNTVILGLTLPSSQLKARIEQRVDAMLAAGLQAEVRHLAAQYGWDVEPMKGIGYREWQNYFSGVQNLTETRQKIIKSTVDLAKRQRTWFKRNNSIHWLDNRGEIDKVVEFITTILNNS